MSFPDPRARTTHQIKHCDALLRDLNVEIPVDTAKVAEVTRIRDNIDVWFDDRMAPFEIHDHFDDERKADVEDEITRNDRNRSQR